MGWQGNNTFPLLIVTSGTGFTGQFVYSPGPGFGNLIGSFTAGAGTDPYGNAYLGGVSSYVLPGGVVKAVNMNGGALSGLGAPAAGGPFDLAANIPIGLNRGTLVLNGSNVILPNVPIVTPGQIRASGTAGAGDVPDVWHTPGLGTGWTSVGSPYAAVQYAFDPTGVGGFRVWIRGRVNVGTGTNIFTLTNALYQPAFTHVWPATVISGAGASPGAFVQVMGTADTNPGTVRLINPGTATVVDIEGNFPLD